MITFKFAHNREKYLGLGEAAAGSGYMIGPVIGGLLNSCSGYLVTFMIFAGILLISGIIC